MKLKAQEIYGMYEAISTLSKEAIPMPTAFYIAKNTKIIKDEATSIDEARQNLIMQCAARKEDGSIDTQENGMIKIEDSKIAFFNEEVKKLFETDIELPIKEIPLSALNQINVPIQTIESLLPIILDDSQE